MTNDTMTNELTLERAADEGAVCPVCAGTGKYSLADAPEVMRMVAELVRDSGEQGEFVWRVAKRIGASFVETVLWMKILQAAGMVEECDEYGKWRWKSRRQCPETTVPEAG